MPILTFRQVAEVCAGILKAAGAREDEARLKGEYLARANLYGHDSHGIQNAPYYVMLIRDGLLKPKANWRVVKETPGTALIDGGWGSRLGCMHGSDEDCHSEGEEVRCRVSRHLQL